MTFWWCWLVYQTGKRNCFEAELAFKPSFGYWKHTYFPKWVIVKILLFLKL